MKIIRKVLECYNYKAELIEHKYIFIDENLQIDEKREMKLKDLLK